jgi:formate-dependent phosphoribosylglycinamide formyltransferase (GAR transformylase)
MLDLDTSRTVVVREVDDFISRLGAASDADWQRPVRCEGWTILDMARHVAWGEAVQADGLRKMIAGSSELPTAVYLGPDSDSRATLAHH